MNSPEFLLYNYMWHNNYHPGYVVYRDSPDRRVGLDRWIAVHHVALFVHEAEAIDYCLYRNRLTEERGTDEIPLRPLREES